MPVKLACPDCGWIGDDCICIRRGQPLALCTRDDHCQAAADAHAPDCPVELELLGEIGF